MREAFSWLMFGREALGWNVALKFLALSGPTRDTDRPQQ